MGDLEGAAVVGELVGLLVGALSLVSLGGEVVG